MDSKPTRRRPVLPFVGVSLLLHLQLLLIAVAVLSANPEGCRPDGDLALPPLEVALVDQTVDEPQQQIEKLERKEREELEEERDAKGQVVELPRPSEEKRPDEARYLSEYDSRVERETKGPAVPFKPGRATRTARVAPQPAQRRSPATEKPTEQRKQRQLAMRVQPEPPDESQSDPDVRGEERARRRPVPRRPTGSEQEPVEQPSISGNLVLSDEELAEALGSRVNDALTDVDEGENTLLNSKRWRFASFFNRVKRQVAQNWHPDRVYRRRDPAGNVYGFKDRLTILRVKLDPKGELKDVHVEQPSGLAFLDDEAINAFRLAQPFPNPPHGLVNGDTGLISFRFGFLFELSRRPNLRIFRYSDP